MRCLRGRFTTLQSVIHARSVDDLVLFCLLTVTVTGQRCHQLSIGHVSRDHSVLLTAGDPFSYDTIRDMASLV